MTSGLAWLAAFPIQPATEAVEALLEAWRELTCQPRPNFNPKTEEPNLTKTLKIYVETVTAPKRGLLGMWAAEDVFGDVDPSKGKITQQRRTDIVYGWNNTEQAIQLVFEFKKLGRQASSRNRYIHLSDGLGRFVNGIYSRHQAVAAMVGVLLDPKAEVVPPLKNAFSDTAVASGLRLRPAPSGTPYYAPSDLFAAADFDTEHERDPAVAPSHGTIRVAHFFFEFGYPASTAKKRTAVAGVATVRGRSRRHFSHHQCTPQPEGSFRAIVDMHVADACDHYRSKGR